jgi:predicted phosphoribosyltransferase
MFIDREDAGNKLGEALGNHHFEDPLLLAIPRGGIEVGYYAAKNLNCDFDVVVARKLGYPQHPEAAFGAVAEDGSLYLNPYANHYLNKEIIQEVLQQQRKEVVRQISVFRKDIPLPELKGRTVIVVDDGIASGSTIFAALLMCQKRHPMKLVVAAPVSGVDILPTLKDKADAVVILEQRERYIAVSEAYLHFSNLTDRQVHVYIDMWHRRNNDRGSGRNEQQPFKKL